MAERCAAYRFGMEGQLIGICNHYATASRGDLLVCADHTKGVIEVCEGCAHRRDLCKCEGVTSGAQTV